ncbi:MAG: dihydrolipoyl dehydrogenase [Leptonema sp. (in: bacteria)]
MQNYDLVIIGSGPGGYVAAIRSAQLGLKTAIIEKSELGGICLNWGCIPTKALLDSAHLLQKIQQSEEFGISVESYKVDFSKIIQRSRNVANQMSKGVQYLMKKNNIDVYAGYGMFKDTHTIVVYKDESLKEIVEELKTKKTILAIGARARELPNIPIDGEFVIDYKKAMSLQRIPKKLLVIGAGAIGIEFSDFYCSLGSDVTIIEILPQILPNEDEEIAKVLENSFKKRNIKIFTNSSIQNIEKNSNSVMVEFLDKDQKLHKEEFEKILLATGIIANTDKMNLSTVFVDLIKDKIKVNHYYQTSNPDIYAIGDCIPTPALAHVASFEGIKAVEALYLSLRKENKLNQTEKFSIQFEPLDYSLIPFCTYSNPEVASFGLTEKKAKEQGYSVSVGRFPLQASGRARASGESEGLAKVVIDKKYQKILGIHIIGKNATEIITEGLLAAKSELLAENIANTIHPHPTISEILMEAAADSYGEAINK